MALQFRTQGIIGENLPTKGPTSITPADFTIGCVVGQFERKYDVAVLCNTFNEFQDRFGVDYSSSYYGYESVSAFFANALSGKLYVKSHVGWTGSAIDAVAASSALVDGTPATKLTLQAAYQNDLAYGDHGNRIGYTLTNGTRSSTTVKTSGAAADLYIICTSVADINVGDLIKTVLTGGGGATVYHLVKSVDASTGKVYLKNLAGTAIAVHATANAAATDVVSVLGFRIKTYWKDINSIVTEVDKNLGLQWLSTQSDNTKYFVENVMNPVSKWLKGTVSVTTPATLDKLFPVDVATVTYLAAGADGTAPTTAAHWSRDLTKLDGLPVRFICNPETTDQTIQAAMETYSKDREDNDEPKIIYNCAMDQTKAQLITIGQNLQRTDEVLGVLMGTWQKITDPFNQNPLAPPRNIPGVGFAMGAWIRTIIQKGIHCIPAQNDTPLYGSIGPVNSNFPTPSKADVTDLLNVGVNISIIVPGAGNIIRTFNTPCTSLDYVFANGGLMKSYIKVSIMTSLAAMQNEPNTIARILSGRDAIYAFMYNLYLKGSTGSAPEGETFGLLAGQKPDDTFQVQGDEINNPVAGINRGERNYAIYFSRPTPTGSVKIGVGLLIPA